MCWSYGESEKLKFTSVSLFHLSITFPNIINTMSPS